MQKLLLPVILLLIFCLPLKATTLGAFGLGGPELLILLLVIAGIVGIIYLIYKAVTGFGGKD